MRKGRVRWSLTETTTAAGAAGYALWFGLMMGGARYLIDDDLRAADAWLLGVVTAVAVFLVELLGQWWLRRRRAKRAAPGATDG